MSTVWTFKMCRNFNSQNMFWLKKTTGLSMSFFYTPELGGKQFGAEAIHGVEPHRRDDPEDAGDDQVGELRRHQVDEESTESGKDHAQNCIKKTLNFKTKTLKLNHRNIIY